jgi:hypothetical protein
VSRLRLSSHAATSRGARRVALTAGALGLVAALGATPALAFWSTSGSASAGATARALATPAAPTTVGSATASSLVVSGTLPTGASQVPGTAYTLKRDATTLGCALPATGTYSCTDTGLTGATTYSYTVVAALGAWRATSTAKTGTTTCPVTPRYTVAASTSTPTVGTAFTVTVTATNCSGATDTTYSGSQAVTFSGPGTSTSGKAPVYPATMTFANGVGVASVTLYRAETTTITATAGALTGTTSSLTVGVTAAAPWTVLLTNPGNSAGAVTVSCTDAADLNAATHSCSQTSAVDTGNSRTWTGRFTLVDKWGNPLVNSGAAISIAVNASNGQTKSVSIATGSATSGTFSIPLANGSSTITLTATSTTPAVSTTVTGAG